MATAKELRVWAASIRRWARMIDDTRFRDAPRYPIRDAHDLGDFLRRAQPLFVDLDRNDEGSNLLRHCLQCQRD